MTETTGRCLCGAVTWRFAGAPVFTGFCACDNCRRATGTEHNSIIVAAPGSWEIVGETVAYEHVADSGNRITRHCCASCGSPVATENSSMPEMRGFTAGGMDDPSAFEASLFVYHAKKAPWDRAGAGCTTFDAMPPMPG